MKNSQMVPHLIEAKDLKSKRDNRGQGSEIAKSFFAEAEELTMQFKMWARSDMEHLNIMKAQEFIINNLVSKWTVSKLKQ